MKKSILFAVASILSLSVFAQKLETGVNWMTYDEAVKANKKEPRKIIMDIYTVWCGPCKMLEKNTFSNPEIATYINENYYAVKFNAEGNEVIAYKGTTYTNKDYVKGKSGRNATHPFASIGATNGNLAYPTIVVFNENFDLITPFVGYKTPEQLSPILRFFIESEEISQESFNKYMESISKT